MYQERLDRMTQRRQHALQRLAWAKDLGAILKEQREARTMKQSDLSDLTGIDQGSISLFERGQVDLSVGRVRLLLHAVGLDLAITDLS